MTILHTTLYFQIDVHIIFICFCMRVVCASCYGPDLLVFTPQSLRAVGGLFSPMVSRWAVLKAT